MSTYTVIFRTNAWDEGIVELADQARGCCGSGSFVVAADETNGPVPVQSFSKFSHDDDFSSLALPRMPRNRVLWWNADFVLYSIRKSLPDTDYYVMLENDVFLNCDLDDLIRRCAQEGVDFAAHEIRRLPETHWSRPFICELTVEPLFALIPFIIVSGSAVDALLRARQALFVGMRAGWVKHWPHCATFIPSVISEHKNMLISDVARLVNADMLRSRPVLSIRDPLLHKRHIIAHPVLSGERFVQALLASEPTGDLTAERLIKAFVSSEPTHGESRSELASEDLTAYQAAFVRVAFPNDPGTESYGPHRLKHFRLDSAIEHGHCAEGLAVLLEEQDSQELFVKSVTAVVQQKILGLEFGDYNIDMLAGLSAAIDSSQYAVSNMSEARRFANGDLLRDFAAECAPPSGMILEFGVFSGHTINRLADRLPSRRIFGFDSFQGLPEPWAPGFEKGAFRRSDLPQVRENVGLVVGWFDQTLHRFLDDHPDDPVSLLHIDCDLYSSTKTVFSLLADRIVPGTIIIFDEYLGFPGWRLHEYRAFQEFVMVKRVTYKYIGLVPSAAQVLVSIVDVR